MYSTGQRSHSESLFSFAVRNRAFTGDLTSSHAGLELAFSLEGRGAAEIEIRGRVHSLANSVLVYNPREEHREIFRRPDQAMEAMVFPVQALQNTLGQNFDHVNFVFDAVQANDPAFVSRTKALYRVLRNNELDPLIVNGLSEGFLTYVFSRSLPARNADGAARQLASYLSAHFQDSACWLGAAENKFGVTKFHLIRSFKARYGMTPHRFLTELRLQYAAERLRARHTRITEIAFSSGYEDLSAFNKGFKKRFGRAPREFAPSRRNSLT